MSDSLSPALLTHRQLSLFREIMRHGSLSRAAEAGHTSQPTLSRELARLEQVLGFDLFDRVRGRLRPTARALALMQEVERSFIGLEHIALRAQELRTLGAAHLRLACLPALAHALVPRALVQLAILQPQALVSVHPMESPWLEQALAEQRFDLGLSEASNAPQEVESRVLLDCQEVAVLPVNHPLCSKSRLDLQDFAGQRFINLAPQDPYRQAIDRLFADAGVQRLQNLETESAVAICAMVRQGLGLAIVNPLSALECAGNGMEVRPLNANIAFHVRLMLPRVATPHPLRATLEQALQNAAKNILSALV
jgi:DNA-binding transcriptional LysR family regulator